MKRIYLLFLWCCTVSGISAQLTITPGAQFVLTGNAQLTLSNIDFINNGTFTAGMGSVLFTGSAVNRVTGSQYTTLYDLNIGQNAGSVQLQVPLSVSHQVIFTSGLLDLNGNDLNLGSTGTLMGEQEASHIIGPNGGSVAFTTSLDAPSSVNPANLGLIITSTQNLGNITINRGHLPQTNMYGGGTSILRYYDIQSANNTSLNATLRLNYFDEELNGLDENSLTVFEKQGTAQWMDLGSDTRNSSTNYVEKNGISSLGRFTLSSVNNALPVKFMSFTIQCNGNSVLLTWKTAQERNSQYYLVEKSTDGVVWGRLGNVAAAGNAAAENDYSFIDNTAAGNSYYRVAEYDIDGNIQFTNILRTSCNIQELVSVWPNPPTDILYISIPRVASSNATIKLFDSKGALVKQLAATLAAGNNFISLDVKRLASGIYYVAIISATGKVQTQRVMKE